MSDGFNRLGTSVCWFALVAHTWPRCRAVVRALNTKPSASVLPSRFIRSWTPPPQFVSVCVPPSSVAEACIVLSTCFSPECCRRITYSRCVAVCSADVSLCCVHMLAVMTDQTCPRVVVLVPDARAGEPTGVRSAYCWHAIAAPSSAAV